MRKDIPRTPSRLILATKKISSKNLTRLALSVTEKVTTTLPKVSSVVPSIFYALTSIGLTERPSFLVKVGWMALTLLPESKSTDTGTDFFWKVMGYQMHGTCKRFSGFLPLLLLPSIPVPAGSTASAVPTISFLVSVIGKEVARTDTSFLTLLLDSKETSWSNDLSGNSCSTQLGGHLSHSS